MQVRNQVLNCRGRTREWWLPLMSMEDGGWWWLLECGDTLLNAVDVEAILCYWIIKLRLKGTHITRHWQYQQICKFSPIHRCNYRCQSILDQAYSKHSIQICQDTWSTQTNPISRQTKSKGGSLQHASETEIRIWSYSLEPTYPI